MEVNTPVKITLPLSSDADPTKVGIFYRNGSVWEYQDSTVINGVVVATVNHFSTYGVLATSGTVNLVSQSSSIDGTQVKLTFDEPLNNQSIPAVTDFSVTNNSVPIEVTNITLDGDALILDLAKRVYKNDQVEISYTVGGKHIRDLDGNSAQGFVDRPVETTLAQGTPSLEVVVGVGTANGSTKATISGVATHQFVVNVTDSSVDTPNTGDAAPVTGANLVSAYTSGEDITTGVVVNKYLQVYDVDSSDNIVGFFQRKLTSADVRELNTTSVVTSVTLGGGVSSIIIPASGTTTFAAFTATVKDQTGNVMPEESVIWSLKLPLTGVSIDALTGVIEVESSTSPGSITVVAKSSSNLLVTTTSAITLNPTVPIGWEYSGLWHINYNNSNIQNGAVGKYVELPIGDNSNGLLPNAPSGVSFWFGLDAAQNTYSIGNYLGELSTIGEDWSGGNSDITQYGDLISPVFNVPQTNNVVLNFKSWWEIEGVDPTDFDLMEVYVLAGDNEEFLARLNPVFEQNSESQSLAYTSGGYNKPAVWRNYSFDLSNYTGQEIRIVFKFDTGDTAYNAFRGWFIDTNVKILDALDTAGSTVDGLFTDPGLLQP